QVTGSPLATDASGNYTFGSLGPGTYFACEESVTGWIQTYPNASTGNPTGESIYNACNNITGLNKFGYKFTSSSGSNLTGDDFGNFQLVSKSGSKVVDSNGDGSLTGDSNYTGGWDIKLFKDNGTTSGTLDSGDTLVDTQTTNGSGTYSFTGIGPG